MGLQNWVILGVVGYFILQLAIAIWASRTIKNEKDFLVAGRSLGTMMVAISLFATWFGAETVMGSSAAVAQEGLSGARADPFGYAITLLGMGLLLAYQMRKRNYLTIGDFLKDRFGRQAELIGTIILIPSIITWAGVQMLAFGNILEAITGIPLHIGIIAASILVIAYASIGGLLGDVITDYLQGVVVIVGILILFIMVVTLSGGIGPLFAGIQPQQLNLVPEGESILSRFELWTIPILGSLVSQVALARILAAKSPTIARRACFLAFGIYLTVGIMPVLIALAAPNLGIAMGEGDAFLPELAFELLPQWMYIIFMGALVSAILSTVDSTLLTISALTSHNILQPMLGKMSEARKVTMNRAFVVVAGLLAYLVAALSNQTILSLVVIADSIGTAGLVVVVLIGLYSRFGGPLAALSAIAVGMFVPPLSDIWFGVEAPWLMGLLLAVLSYSVVAMFERRRAVAI